MSMSVPLPSALQHRLAGVARRARTARSLRGVGWLVLLLSVGMGLALLADFLLGLPALFRLGLLTAWALLGAVTLARAVLAPMVRRMDQADLAAAVEEQYPQLGERLLSSVELSRDDRP